MGQVSTLTEATFREEIATSSAPILVDFWAEWCGPCKKIAPILQELASESETLRFGKLNVEDHEAPAREHAVTAIPTMIVFQDGEPVKRITGAMSKHRLMEELADYL